MLSFLSLWSFVRYLSYCIFFHLLIAGLGDTCHTVMRVCEETYDEMWYTEIQA
jgi:hypothetical protein